MPLYSASELNREREKEYKRRTDTAATIGAFLSALAKRNHSIRELGLYQSLEARSQVRVYFMVNQAMMIFGEGLVTILILVQYLK